MSHYQKSYDDLSKADKEKIIRKMYVEKNCSFYDIAKEYGTYANKIRRDAIAFKIPIRNKSEAQKNALRTGNHKHPTKGTERNQNTKDKIGMGVLNSWAELSPSELNDRKNNARQQWNALSEDQKEYILKCANNAVRLTSKTGSKLEKFILNKLLQDGFKVDFHKEQTLLNTKLQIDLFLPKINTAIEIDGPSHFLPVWGDDVLAKNQTYDQKKEGLILGKGWKLIRIKQTKDFSKTRSSLIYNNLLTILKEIIDNKNSDKTFIIEDTNE